MAYFSLSFFIRFSSKSTIRFTKPAFIFLIITLDYKKSREILRKKSFESTIPLTNRKVHWL